MMTNKKTIACLAVIAAIGALGACSSDDDDGHGHTHESSFPDCDAIIEACHEKDVGQGGTITECHSTAHEAKSEAECTPKKDSCVAACNAAVVDGGAHDQ